MVEDAPDAPLVVRTAVDADVPALLLFWQLVGENAGRPADAPEAIARLIVHDPEAVLLGEVDSELAATLVVGWDGWRANLYRLAVDPRHRGRGFAQRLLEHAEGRLAGLGVARACAMVLDDNSAGAAFWRAAGYAPQDDWSRWVKPLG